MKHNASKKRIHRLIAMIANGSLTAVVEKANRCGESMLGRKMIAAALALNYGAFMLPQAMAAPTGGQVVSGVGAINQSGSTTNIKQTTQNLSLNWNTFNIAPAETVNFVQPNAAAVAVNRIFDTNGSQILGHLNANGQVYLINPNGILFGQGAHVNVGGLVASALDINDASLNSNTRTFSGNGTGSVVNQGNITAANGGYVALIGNHVGNQGIITAQLGTVAMGAGNALTLTFTGNSLVHMQVDQSTLNALAENGGLIQADGGMVIMSAGAKNSLLASVVNNTGVVEARTVDSHNGTITLLGGMTAGTVNAGGTLDASAPNGGNGGFIETSAAHVSVANGTKITTMAAQGKAGTWLIDPQDYSILASGGDITGAQLGLLLNSSNIVIDSTKGAVSGVGDINIYDAVTWTGTTTLTLNAYHNVNFAANTVVTNNTGGSFVVHADDTGTGAGTIVGAVLNQGSVNMSNGGSVSFYYNPPTGSYLYPTVFTGVTVSLGTTFNNYMLVNNAANLQAIGSNPTASYALGTNINLSGTFTPITSFSGILNGGGHTISGLSISDATGNSFGMIGLNYGTIENLNFANVSITNTAISTITGSPSGGFGPVAGINESTGIINNVVVSSGIVNTTVSQGRGQGGLVGYNNGTISNSQTSANLTASGINYMGGVAGGNSGIISLSGANGAVSCPSGDCAIGGLVASNFGTINQSYATGAVSAGGGSNIGGLVAVNYASITQSFATGKVSGGSAAGSTGSLNGESVGGLVGWNLGTVVSDSYATGAVSAGPSVGTSITYVGGVIGLGNPATNIYAAGAVSGGTGALVGALVGSGSATNGFFDPALAGTSTPFGNSTVTSGSSTFSVKTGISPFPGFSTTIWTFPATPLALPYLSFQTSLLPTAGVISPAPSASSAIPQSGINVIAQLDSSLTSLNEFAQPGQLAMSSTIGDESNPYLRETADLRKRSGAGGTAFLKIMGCGVK